MDDKENKIQNFDPSAIGIHNGNLYGLPFSAEESDTIVIPVPWEVTTSYGGGTFMGPEAILSASTQVDLYDSQMPDAWKSGISLLPIPKKLIQKNNLLKKKAGECVKNLENGGSQSDPKFKKIYEEINSESAEMNEWVKNEALKWLAKDKQVAVLGGDHSVPLGLIQALAEKYQNFSVLHFDAHLDLRDTYEGFEFSHASIMRNVLKIKNVDRLVQVAIRDYSHSEMELVNNSNGRVKIFDDRNVNQRLFAGETWKSITKDIIKRLNKNVHISFDIDALDPALCPHTGTPVPGGLGFEQALYVIETLVASGHKIIGFDLCEVAPGKDEWDAAIGARLLYRINNLMMKSQTSK